MLVATAAIALHFDVNCNLAHANTLHLSSEPEAKNQNFQVRRRLDTSANAGYHLTGLSVGPTS